MSEKMIFCLGEGGWEKEGEGYQKSLRIFNQDVSEEEFESTRKLLIENDIKIKLTEYKNDSLTVYRYEDAWKNFWDNASKEQKDCVLNIKQFDAEIFKGITGIDVEENPILDTERTAIYESGYKAGHSAGVLEGSKAERGSMREIKSERNQILAEAIDRLEQEKQDVVMRDWLNGHNHGISVSQIILTKMMENHDY